MTESPTLFAAFDADLIWGVGPTEAAAIADASANRDPTRPAEAARAEYETAEMTPALAAQVEAHGGDVARHMLADGRLGTWGEWEDDAD